MTLSDPDRALGRVRSQFQQGNAPLPILDPGLSDTEPATVSTEATQRLIQKQSEEEVKAIRESMDLLNQEQRRARNRALLNLAGPTAFKAFTGADIDTGLEERLRQQREAERRAAELEREATREIPRILGEGDIQAQQLETETERQNQEARQAAQQRRFDALTTLADQTRGISRDVIEARQEQAEGSGGGAGGRLDFSDPGEATEFVRNNPGLRPNTVRDVARSVGLRPGELFRVQRDAQEGGGAARNAISIADDLQTLRTLEQRASDPNATLSIPEEEQLQSLREQEGELRTQLQQAVSAEVRDLSRDVQDGRVASSSRFTDAIRALNRAEGLGIRSVNFGGEHRDIGEVRDAIFTGLQQVRGQAETGDDRQAQGGQPQ